MLFSALLHICTIIYEILSLPLWPFVVTYTPRRSWETAAVGRWAWKIWVTTIPGGLIIFTGVFYVMLAYTDLRMRQGRPLHICLRIGSLMFAIYLSFSFWESQGG